MATQPETIDAIVARAAIDLDLSARKMFGEYALYAEGKLVALVCDDRLFVKPTPAGRDFAGEVEEAAPYPGAKPSLLIAGDRLDDGAWLAELFRRTAAALPAPVKKAPATRRSGAAKPV